MSNYNYILLDLDGTITMSHVGIINSVKYALKKYGIEENDDEKLLTFIGPPMKVSLNKHYGFEGEQLEEAIAFYREYFVEKGIYENTPYDNIETVLKSMKDSGKTLILATSKAEPYAVQILEHFGYDKYFTVVAGASMDGKLCEKADVIKYALEKLASTLGVQVTEFDKSEFVMIGDRYHDITGAAKNGLESIGVLYGYGDFAELKNAGATHIAKSTLDLLSIIK